MHILQSKHIKLSKKESEELLNKFNISKAQLPKIFINDPALPKDCSEGDIIKIEREEISFAEENKAHKNKQKDIYYRVVV